MAKTRREHPDVDQQILEQQIFSGQFQGMAHRGGAEEAFENSPAAFAHAERLGYRYVETDLQASRDGVLYLFHDSDLARCSTGTGPFGARDAEEIDQLRLKNGEAVPRLADVMARHPGLILNADVKTDAAVGPVIRFLHNAPEAGRRLVLASFSARRLRVIRRALIAKGMQDSAIALSAGQADVVWLYAGQFIGQFIGKFMSQFMGEGRARRLFRPEGILAVQVPPRHYGIEIVTPRFVRHCHRLNLKLHVWTINEADEMRRLIAMGVDGICTDRPALLQAVLAEQGLTP